MDDIEKTLSEIEQKEEIESQFLNCEEAKEFLNLCSDPVTRTLLWTAYGVLTFHMTPYGPDGKFDVLFFIRTLAEVFKDRDRLLRVLSGDLSED